MLLCFLFISAFDIIDEIALSLRNDSTVFFTGDSTNWLPNGGTNGLFNWFTFSFCLGSTLLFHHCFANILFNHYTSAVTKINWLLDIEKPFCSSSIRVPKSISWVIKVMRINWIIKVSSFAGKLVKLRRMLMTYKKYETFNYWDIYLSAETLVK